MVNVKIKMNSRNKSELSLIIFRNLLNANKIIQMPNSPNSDNIFEIKDFGVISELSNKTF